MRGSVTDEKLGSFRHLVLEQGRILWRDLPWRETRDPYAIWISEVMLQQTQVQRVLGRWERWLERFPDVESLAQVPTADVLQEWQGMGYNRRALALHEAAQKISELGSFPTDAKELVALPGIGPTTAAGIRAFAFDLPGIYLDTNVRTVFLHELFPDDTAVPDKAIAPLVERCCPKTAEDPTDDPRTWYYALLDFGAYLKRVAPNPSRRSSSHTKQSKFEGSHRQKRAALLRLVLAAGDAGITAEEAARSLSSQEEAQGRAPVSQEMAESILDDLRNEGFCRKTLARYRA
ncbi:MAG: adenine glycosylase [Atopobiaceae bacterium]|nr:adenine glycosylase [Atopobiaceae bacterium]